MLTQCFYSDHDVWCGAAISRHMWSDQRLLISRDSEGGSEDLKRLFSLTWQWDQRPESASEPWPCATGQVRGKEEASGDAEAALPRVCVCLCRLSETRCRPAQVRSIWQLPTWLWTFSIPKQTFHGNLANLL